MSHKIASGYLTEYAEKYYRLVFYKIQPLTSINLCG